MTNQLSNQHTAVLVVDVQTSVMRHAWNSQVIIENIQKVVEKARRNLVPVIWVQHCDDELVHGSLDWEIVPDLHPAIDEIKVEKNFNSSFEATPLQETLVRLGITHIVLTGAASNWCIRATAHGALDRGYHLTLVSDAHTTESLEFDDGSVFEASDLIRELNTSIQWLSYPGGLNHVARTDEVAYSPQTRNTN